MVAAVFRTIFAQPDPATAASTWDEVRDQLAGRFPKIGPLMDQAKSEVLAFSTFPRAHWSKIWSTNPLERVNKKIKRRARVVGIFPNEAAVIRLVGAVLADMHDEWQSGERRYLSEGRWRCWAPAAILGPSPRSTVASRHRGFDLKAHHPTGLYRTAHNPARASTVHGQDWELRCRSDLALVDRAGDRREPEITLTIPGEGGGA